MTVSPRRWPSPNHKAVDACPILLFWLLVRVCRLHPPALLWRSPCIHVILIKAQYLCVSVGGSHPFLAAFGDGSVPEGVYGLPFAPVVPQ